MNSQKLQVSERLKKIDSLPPFPLLSNILKAFTEADNSGDLRPLTSNLENEPSIAAKVISTANSAFYNSGNSIHSLRDASARLGLNQLKSLILGLVISQRFNSRACATFSISRYWQDVIQFAHCAMNIAKQSNIDYQFDYSQIYSISLLHKIGLLALVNLYPEILHNIFVDISSNKSLREKEKHNFDGLDHYDVGALLLEHWGLPEEFLYCIRNLPEDKLIVSDTEILWVMRLANQLMENNLTVTRPDYMDSLNLSQLDIDTIVDAYNSDKVWISEFSSHL